MMHTSQNRGEVGFGPTRRRHTRWMPPRSMSMSMPATQMHTMEQMTAGFATALNFSMPKTCAELATIRPPAESPTNSMNMQM